MPRVYGIHEVMIHPDFTNEDFERYVAEELPKVKQPEGSRVWVLRGNRGDRQGRYIVVYEFASVEAQERLWPGNLASEEMKAWQAKNAEHSRKWAAFFEHTIYTDYIEMTSR